MNTRDATIVNTDKFDSVLPKCYFQTPSELNRCAGLRVGATSTAGVPMRPDVPQWNGPMAVASVLGCQAKRAWLAA